MKSQSTVHSRQTKHIHMGVRGLPGFLAWASPTLRSTPSWKELEGKTLGIDVLGLLYKAKSMKQSIFVYLSRFVLACRTHAITPVFVFDGKPPDEKRGTLQARATQRRNTIEHTSTAKVWKSPSASPYLTSEERDQAKQLLYACGVLSLNASGEADFVLAYFSKRGHFAAVISNDFDLLARGVTTLLVPEPYALPGDVSGWSSYHLPTILQTIEMTYTQFLDMCVLMGCDYTNGQAHLIYKTAYWAIRFRGTLEDIAAPQDLPAYQKAKELLSGVLDTQESLMGEKQWDKWIAGTPPIEREALEAFRTTRLKALSHEEFHLLRNDGVHDSYMEGG
jgi:5'-3' exonuclease